MRTIPLTQGKVAIVDDKDYEWLNRWKWCALKHHNNWYAIRGEKKNGKSRSILMHREILGLKHGDGIQTDHKDGDGLNNRRLNLRMATHAQNQHNKRKQKGSSQFKGVCWFKSGRCWRSQIRYNGRKIHNGFFSSEIEAALAYDVAARFYFGEFARTNFEGVEL